MLVSGIDLMINLKIDYFYVLYKMLFFSEYNLPTLGTLWYSLPHETESERVFHGTVLLDGTALLHVFTALDPRCLSGIAEIAKISEVCFNEFIYLSSVL